LPTPTEIQETLASLYTALNSGDPDAVENAVTQAYQVGLVIDFTPALVDLLKANWHTRHEDIVGALQRLKDPRAIDVLYETALVVHPYLDYDELFGLARKCTWALADIGTTEARSKLQKLAQSQNILVTQYAQKRLDRWDEERHRKGVHSASQ